MPKTVGLSALLITSVACTGQRAPTKEEAARLIAQTSEFTAASITRTFGLYRGRCIPRTLALDVDENRRYAAIASLVERGGAITATKRQATQKECGLFLASDSDMLAISLTPQGEKDAPEWPKRPVNDMNSQLAMEMGGQRGPDWNVPLQRRRFGEVTGIADPDPATGQVPVEFRWELAGTYDGSSQQKRGTAMFRHYDTGWRIEKVDGLGEK